jgi:hypothetical protein
MKPFYRHNRRMARSRVIVCAVPHACFLFQRCSNCVFKARYPTASVRGS